MGVNDVVSILDQISVSFFAFAQIAFGALPFDALRNDIGDRLQRIESVLGQLLASEHRHHAK